MWWLTTMALAGSATQTRALEELVGSGPRVVCDVVVRGDGQVVEADDRPRCPAVGTAAASALAHLAPDAAVGTWPHVSRVVVDGVPLASVRLVTGRGRLRLRGRPLVKVEEWRSADVFGPQVGPASCTVEVSVQADGAVSEAVSSCGGRAVESEQAAMAWRFAPLRIDGDAVAFHASVVVPLEVHPVGQVEDLALPVTPTAWERDVSQTMW
jgi:hypothetical protein